MKSLEFTITRATATRDAQETIAATWIWPDRTMSDWNNNLTVLASYGSAENVKRVDLQAQAAAWDVNIQAIYEMTRDVMRMGRTRFRNDPVNLALFKRLKNKAGGRLTVQKQGAALRDAWQKADAAWVPLPTVTLAALNVLLTASENLELAYGQKFNAWREAAERLMLKAEEIDRDNVAWYADATTRFPEGTVYGNMIRSTVPTTTSPINPVGQAVISNVMAANGTIHFDCSAPHASQYTYLHKPPGAAQFVVVQAGVEESSVTLHNQPAGAHVVKAFGSNSRGPGPESVEVNVTLASALAA